YVEKYYVIQPDDISQLITEQVFPDCGTYLIFGLNGEIYDRGRGITVNPQTFYLVGTMTHSHCELVSTNAKLFGIHFKPASFPLFFDYPLHEVTDEMVKFPHAMLPDVKLSGPNIISVVEKFLLSRLAVS